MSSVTKYKSLFGPSGCLTLETMNRYLVSDLSDDERIAIDLHLKSCELCSDALEGLRLITDKDKLNLIVSEINENLRKNLMARKLPAKPSFQKSGTQYLYFAAAASVVLLIGVFSYLYFYPPLNDSQISVLSPADYENQIPDQPVPKLLKQKPQESVIMPEQQVPADAIKQTLENQKTPIIGKSGSGEKSENYKPAIEDLKSRDTFLTETLAQAENNSSAAETNESEPADVAIASTQPVEYYLGGVIIEAENSDLVLTEMSVANESAETMDVEGIIRESEKNKDKSLEKSATRKKKNEKSSGINSLERNAVMEQSSKENSQSAAHFFRTIDTMPVFQGGEAVMLKFLKDKLQYPPEARMQGIQGTIYISFIVEETGKITTVVIQKGLNEECDKAAVEAVQSMPDWQPGYFEGKLVKVRFTMPITFQIK
jgi:TonB family protein